MRNWNKSTEYVDESVDYRSQTTYEELKRGTGGFGDEMVPLPDYLWGIETFVVRENLDIHATRSQTTYEELKLRSPALPLRSSQCSQTTYEELKLLPHSISERVSPGSQTTYEELKHLSSSAWLSSRHRSQTTYEELKP